MNQRRLRVLYARWKKPTPVSRTADPLGLVLKAGHWYLVARSDGEDRTYRVDRLRELETLEEEFDRPVDFDLAVFWRAYLERFTAARSPARPSCASPRRA